MATQGETRPQPLLIRKNIKMRGNMHLIFDVENGEYRAAVYRPRLPKEEGNVVPMDVYEGMTRAAMLPKKPRDYWVRFTMRGPNLSGTIDRVLRLAGLQMSIPSIMDYIRNTEWGQFI